MDTATKISLSTLETELVQNKEWILTKRKIIEKVYLLFGEALENYREILGDYKFSLPEFNKASAGKISRGENYHGLPYVILDYPGLFARENIFAIRTMFWWGNFFSISLHVSGKYLQDEWNSASTLQYLHDKAFFICTNDDQWQHHFETSNYIAAKELKPADLYKIKERNFFKISKKLEVGEWDNVQNFLQKTFVEITTFLNISFPAGETDL